MAGSAASLAAFALQLLTALEGPGLGLAEPRPPDSPAGSAARVAPNAAAPDRKPGWLVLRREEAQTPADVAAVEAARPQ